MSNTKMLCATKVRDTLQGHLEGGGGGGGGQSNIRSRRRKRNLLTFACMQLRVEVGVFKLEILL